MKLKSNQPVIIIVVNILFGLFIFSQTYGFDYGNPTSEEQYMLELINRARQDPPTEGHRLVETEDSYVQQAIEQFEIDTQQIINEFAVLSPKPPLAMQAQLLQAARGHTQDMLDNNFQGHISTDGKTLGDRISETGYNYSRAGENVYSYSYSLWFGHCGFQIDWGNPDPGHRKTIMEYDNHGPWREVGIGILHTETQAAPGLNALPLIAPGVSMQTTQVGPILITQDFASTWSDLPLILGVVYEDKDKDDFYSVGEGISGVTITLKSVHNEYTTTTADAGGFADEVNSGVYIVTASGGPFSEAISKSVTVNDDNVKVDFKVGDVSEVATATPTPTNTIIPTDTPTNTYTSTPTFTNTPTDTPVQIITATPTETPVSTIPTARHPEFDVNQDKIIDRKDLLEFLKDWHYKVE